jgi:archaellum biogenesis ATPase FlaH
MEVSRRVNKEKTYRLKIKPMLKWAKQNNYDLSENLDPDIVQQISADFLKAEQESEARQQKLKQLSEQAKAVKKE